MVENNFAKAEEFLLEVRKAAQLKNDFHTMQYVFTELIGLCHISEPPLWAKAETISSERESLIPSSYNKLQTAMILHHGIHDSARAVAKLEDAIVHGRTEHDDGTVYASLGLLGQISLELGHTERALVTLNELEAMVARKGRFVVGDETCFLESLQARNLEIERVSRLASVLVPVCRDPLFKERLTALIAQS